MISCGVWLWFCKPGVHGRYWYSLEPMLAIHQVGWKFGITVGVTFIVLHQMFLVELEGTQSFEDGDGSWILEVG